MIHDDLDWPDDMAPDPGLPDDPSPMRDAAAAVLWIVLALFVAWLIGLVLAVPVRPPHP